MPFRVTCERRDFGYATYRCFAGADFFADHESALDELVMALSRELSLYYLAYAHRVMEFIAWRRIDGSARGALLARRRKGWKSTVRRVVGMVRRSHKLTRLTTMLIQFEMVRMENRQLIERERQRIYANNTNIFCAAEQASGLDFPGL